MSYATITLFPNTKKTQKTIQIIVHVNILYLTQFHCFYLYSGTSVDLEKHPNVVN